MRDHATALVALRTGLSVVLALALWGAFGLLAQRRAGEIAAVMLFMLCVGTVMWDLMGLARRPP